MLAHEIVDERVRQHLVPHRAHQVDGLVQRFLSNLEEKFEGLLVLASLLKQLCRRLKLLLVLVVLRHRDVLALRALGPEKERECIHEVVRLSQLTRLLVVLGDDHELDGGADFAVARAVLDDLGGAGVRARLAHDAERALGRLELFEAEAHHAVHVLPLLVRVRRLFELARLLLGLGVADVQLRRRDLVHERLRCLEVLELDVQPRSFVEGAALFVHERCVRVLLDGLEDLAAVATDHLAALRRQLHALDRVAGLDVHARHA
mmetsp:Transcript_13440/g.31548  ORF Transcript_13440/g.31548 Transcript_13440/m.31548 type:complete len:262 (+) Transcript_13440:989-1774(+)